MTTPYRLETLFSLESFKPFLTFIIVVNLLCSSTSVVSAENLVSFQSDPSEAWKPSSSSVVHRLLYTSNNSTSDHPVRVMNPDLETAMGILNENEFAIIIKIQQDTGSVATLIYLEDIQTKRKLLEVQSSSRRAELRINFADTDGGKRNAIFGDIQLGDQRWHEVVLRFSGDELSLYIDCVRKGSRFIPERQQEIKTALELLLFGQPDLNVFKGAAGYVKVYSGPRAIQQQCPQIQTECLTCGQFQQMQRVQIEILSQLYGEKLSLQNQVDILKKMVFQLTDSVEELERVALPHCYVDGKRQLNGSTWRDGCLECTCKDKKITCEQVRCSEYDECSDPSLDPCCRSHCGRNCTYQNELIQHSQTRRKFHHQTCMAITCEEGVVTTAEADCPKLDCPPSDRFFRDGDCCQECRNKDHCGSFAGQCVDNAICVNHGFSPKCICKEGYTGDGRVKCEDVDECANEGGHHCAENSICVNTAGNYSCHCQEGYQMDSRGFCLDINECLERDFCDAGARCSNLIGGYKCECPKGFISEGRSCKPVCTSECRHGGMCVAPDRCECRLGYRGSFCEHDVDECQENLHACGPNAKCTNLPGWYSCQCENGFQPVISNGTTRCQDIDECETGQHLCLSRDHCLNAEGTYHCQCSDKPENCPSSCQVLNRGIQRTIPSGGSWFDEANCESCTCSGGVKSCKAHRCNCNANPSRKCCPHCFQQDEYQCKLPTEKTNASALLIANGQRITHGCQICECLYGSLDCWTTVCPRLSCVEQHFPADLCCPVCRDQEDTCAPAAAGSRGRGCHYKDSLFIGDGQQMQLGRTDTCKNCPSSGKVLYRLHRIARRSSSDAVAVPSKVTDEVKVHRKWRNDFSGGGEAAPR